MSSITAIEDKANETERILSKLYEKIFDQIEKDVDYPDNMESVRQKFNRKVSDITRKALQKISLIGIEYTGRKLRIDIFVTNTDIELLKSQTAFITNLFSQIIQSDIEWDNKNNFLINLNNNNNNNLPGAAVQVKGTIGKLLGLARTVITTMLAKSILSKGRQLTRSFFEGFSAPVFELIDHVDTTQTNQPIVMWQTAQDERVRPICFPLEGQKWLIDDPNIPIPWELSRNGRTNTHPNCHCRLLSV